MMTDSGLMHNEEVILLNSLTRLPLSHAPGCEK